MKYNGEEMYFLSGTSCFNPTIVLPVEILMCFYLTFYLLLSFSFSSDVINSYKKKMGRFRRKALRKAGFSCLMGFVVYITAAECYRCQRQDSQNNNFSLVILV